VTAAFGGDANYLASTGGTSGTGGSSLNFGFTVQPAPPTITWAPSPSLLTVTYGPNLSSVLTAAASSGGSAVPGSFSYTETQAGGSPSAVSSSTILGPGVYTLTVTFTPTDTKDYSTQTATITYTVVPATPPVVLVAAPNPVFITTTVTYTVTVTGTATTPGGTVTIYDGGVPLGSPQLGSNGVATLQNAPTTVGTHTITAKYNGSSFYNQASSNPVAELAQDFSVAVASGGSGSASVLPGATATYALVVTPLSGPTFPGAISLTQTGGPAGATVTLSPGSVASGSGATNLALTVATANTVLGDSRHANGLRKLAPISFALLLLPLAGLRRSRRTWQRYLALLLIVVGGAAATGSLSGCNLPSGYFGQAPANVTITVTGTSGALTHSTSVTLTIE
jgi:hypothetical protein